MLTCGCQSDVYKMPIQYCSQLSDSVQELKETSENKNKKNFFEIEMVSRDDMSEKESRNKNFVTVCVTKVPTLPIPHSHIMCKM